MLRRKFKRNYRHSGFVILLGLCICFITICYAALSSSFNIGGATTIAQTAWNVYFTNVQAGGSVMSTEPTITNNTSIKFNATLNPPNEYYRFLVDVVNDGVVDAMIKDITTSTLGNFSLSITYRNGTPVSINDLLKAGTRETLLVTLNYKENLFSDEVIQSVELNINYGQAEEIATEPQTSVYTVKSLKNLSNDITTSDYNSGIKSEMYTFKHVGTKQLGGNTDYRYIGSEPNNYIKFNNEMWRIIGIFPTDDGSGVYKNRLKIIKDASYRNMMRDYKMTGVGSSTTDNGSNDWTDSQLMYFLNPDDIGTNAEAKGYTFDGSLVKDTNGTVIYEKGKLPAKVVNGATTYSGQIYDWVIGEDKQYIDSVKYYLGGMAPVGSAVDYYTDERGNKIYSGMTKSWIGKVALMYPSDYAFTFDKGVDDTCYNNLYICRLSEGGTPEKSWLYQAGHHQWLISSYYNNNYHSFYVLRDGRVPYYNSSFSMGMHPVAYLKSDIKLSGSGTLANPYNIIK